MKLLFIVFSIFITQVVNAQGFEMNKDLGDDFIVYQNIVQIDSLSKAELKGLAIKWETESKFDQKFISEDTEAGDRTYELIFSVIGKKSELGKEYHYRFSTKLKLEFKDQKLRYTFSDFTKKSSPGAPGMSLENYIKSYQPKISSVESRQKAEDRMDEIEMNLDKQVLVVIENLKKQFTANRNEW